MPDILTLEHDGLQRRCLVLTPETPPPWPVVLFFHGTGATAAWSAEETGLDRAAPAAGYLLLAPEGTCPDPSRPPGFLQNPQGWHDGGRTPQVLGLPEADDVGFVEALLDEVQFRYPIDPRRVGVSGFSSGAAMTFRVGAELAHRLAALAPVAGNCWLERPRPEPAVPTLFVAGKEDPFLPLTAGDVAIPWDPTPRPRPGILPTLDHWARALGCPVDAVALSEDDGIELRRWPPGRDEATLTAYLVAGLGHHWPGGRSQLSRRVFGPPSSRLNATATILEFFGSVLLG
jgi:polyhydroxybutyrate depolymerase